MAIPDEVEMVCKKCGHLQWVTKLDAQCFTITCFCGSPMRKTMRRKEFGEIIEPEPPKVIPTMIPQDVVDKTG